MRIHKSIQTLLVTAVGLFGREMDSTEAKLYAARVANEKLDSIFGVYPFSPDNYDIHYSDSTWKWGKIEPKKRGYSAEVSFRINGENPKVNWIYVGPNTDCIDGEKGCLLFLSTKDKDQIKTRKKRKK